MMTEARGRVGRGRGDSGVRGGDMEDLVGEKGLDQGEEKEEEKEEDSGGGREGDWGEERGEEAQEVEAKEADPEVGERAAKGMVESAGREMVGLVEVEEAKAGKVARDMRC